MKIVSVSLLVLCVTQAAPPLVDVTDDDHPAGSAGALTPSKFSFAPQVEGPVQTSPVVQAFRSSHGPLLYEWLHWPFAELHKSVVHWLPSLQSIGVPGWHTPFASQVSPPLQGSPSLQLPPAPTATCWQPVTGSPGGGVGLQLSVVHGLLSLHEFTGPGWQLARFVRTIVSIF